MLLHFKRPSLPPTQKSDSYVNSRDVSSTVGHKVMPVSVEAFSYQLAAVDTEAKIKKKHIQM